MVATVLANSQNMPVPLYERPYPLKKEPSLRLQNTEEAEQLNAGLTACQQPWDGLQIRLTREVPQSADRHARIRRCSKMEELDGSVHFAIDIRQHRQVSDAIPDRTLNIEPYSMRAKADGTSQQRCETSPPRPSIRWYPERYMSCDGWVDSWMADTDSNDTNEAEHSILDSSTSCQTEGVNATSLPSRMLSRPILLWDRTKACRNHPGAKPGWRIWGWVTCCGRIFNRESSFKREESSYLSSSSPCPVKKQLDQPEGRYSQHSLERRSRGLKIVLASASLEASCILRNFARRQNLLSQQRLPVLYHLGEDDMGISSFLATALRYISSRAGDAGNVEGIRKFWPPEVFTEPSVMTSFAAALLLTYLLTWYSDLNRKDSYQYLFVCASFASLPIVALALDIDILASTLVFMPLLALTGLILSDISHAAGRRWLFSRQMDNACIDDKQRP